MPLSIDLKDSTATPQQHFHDTGDMTMVDTTAMTATGTMTIANTSTAVTGSTTMADITTIATAGTRTMLPHIGDGSSVGNVSLVIPHSITAQGQGPIAFLEERVAILSECTDQAAAFAREAAADAQDFSNAHASIVAKHHKMFLQRAFGINPDGTSIIDASKLPKKLKKYKSVKTVEQYQDIICVLTNWGDDDVLKNASYDDSEASTKLKFRKSNPQGYNYVKYFDVEKTETLDGSVKMILKHKNSGGVVSHMLNIFDVIHDAHCRLGHMKVEKTLANCLPMFYSPTYELCKLFIADCFVCHEKHPSVPATKGAKKPILSSKFCDRIQVDLINMRAMRKRDIYGNMQRWIMTVKNHLTGLVYLCALPGKKAVFVAAELEKYFGLIGYPEIFHTGVYTVTIMLSQ